jgi:hypothetical protein
MGALKVVISDETEQQFRATAMAEFGYGKGALSEAAEALFRTWTSQKQAEEQYRQEAAALGDPIEAISGLLKHVKKTSVELQHEISRMRGERYARHRR